MLTDTWILEGGNTWSRFPSISFRMTLNAITVVLYKSVGGFLLRILAPHILLRYMGSIMVIQIEDGKESKGKETESKRGVGDLKKTKIQMKKLYEL